LFPIQARIEPLAVHNALLRVDEYRKRGVLDMQKPVIQMRTPGCQGESWPLTGRPGAEGAE